jgi:hypothetical protein
MTDNPAPGERLFNVSPVVGSSGPPWTWGDLPLEWQNTFAQAEAEFAAPYLARIAELEASLTKTMGETNHET